MSPRRLLLRPATYADAEMLLSWRNDSATRAASVHQEEIGLEEHLMWLSKILSGKSRRLMVAELSGVAVGTIRADEKKDGSVELSWTVAPERRGKGLGGEMVRLAASTIRAPLLARVRKENAASIRIAEAAGLKPCGEEDGLLVFRS